MTVTVISFLCQTLWPVPGCVPTPQPQGEKTESLERNGGLSAHHRQGCSVAFTFSCSSDDECPARTAVMDSSARHSLLPSAILMKCGMWATLLSISPVHGSSLPFTTRRSVVTWQFNRSHCSFLHIIWHNLMFLCPDWKNTDQQQWIRCIFCPILIIRALIKTRPLALGSVFDWNVKPDL